jgi:hypothetical protein
MSTSTDGGAAILDTEDGAAGVDITIQVDYDEGDVVFPDELAGLLYNVTALDQILKGGVDGYPPFFGGPDIDNYERRTRLTAVNTGGSITLGILGAVALASAIAGGIKKIVEIRREHHQANQAKAETALAEGRERREEERQSHELVALDAKREFDLAQAELFRAQGDQIRSAMRSAVVEEVPELEASQHDAAAAALLGVASALIGFAASTRSVAVNDEVIDVREVED